MFAYNRLNHLFNYIKRSSYLSNKKLAELLSVSERTVRSDIQSINSVLKDYGAQILLKRKAGYYLNITDEPLFNKFMLQTKNNTNGLELDSSEGRIRFILVTLLYSKDYIFIEDLIDLVYISKNTLSNYLKTIKKILKTYKLELITTTSSTIKIVGNEVNMRNCLIENMLSYKSQDYIISFSKEEYAIFDDIDLDKLQKIIDSLFDNLNIQSSDFNRKNLILHFALMISRIKNGYLIDYIELSYNSSITLIEDIIKVIEEQYYLTINAAEKHYIYSHFINNTNYNISNIDDTHIEEIVTSLLLCIYHNYHFDLRNDGVLFQDLISHFRSILNSKALSVNKRNPLLNTIKNNFPLAYEITLTAVCEVFKDYNYTLIEDEIGYISLHIGAAIERCFSGSIQRKKVILVCGSGQATVRMLEARINVFFKDKLTILKKYSYNKYLLLENMHLENVDFIISTIPLENQLLPTVCVDFSLTNRDIETISKFLVTISSNKSKKLNKFFDKSIFTKMISVTSKDTLLKNMCDLLVECDYTDKFFYQSVLAREEIASTNMNKVFALPHPMMLCAKQTKVAVTILDKPLLWRNDDTVQIIFLIAIKKDDHLDIEHLYDIFIQIVTNSKLQNDIIHCNNYQQFIDILNNVL